MANSIKDREGIQKEAIELFNKLTPENQDRIIELLKEVIRSNTDGRNQESAKS